MVTNFDIRDIEKLVRFLKQRLITKVLIIGYVQLPPIKEIKLFIFKINFIQRLFLIILIINQKY